MSKPRNHVCAASSSWRGCQATPTTTAGSSSGISNILMPRPAVSTEPATARAISRAPGVLRAFSTTTRELVASVELKGKRGEAGAHGLAYIPRST
ncbi:Uncharacterised protein [Mycobacteroides abscessus subsp. abscessus]|nr:Uncharacterised protein [Mycobacteroides abscessus subsp. abscessus]